MMSGDARVEIDAAAGDAVALGDIGDGAADVATADATVSPDAEPPLTARPAECGDAVTATADATAGELVASEAAGSFVDARVTWPAGAFAGTVQLTMGCAVDLVRAGLRRTRPGAYDSERNTGAARCQSPRNARVQRSRSPDRGPVAPPAALLDSGHPRLRRRATADRSGD